MSEGFERFWEAYAYKVGRKGCLKIWLRDGLEEHADDICASIPAYDAHLQANPWKHKKHPSTYLNGAHWEDEYPQPKTVNALSAFSKTIRELERIDGNGKPQTH